MSCKKFLLLCPPGYTYNRKRDECLSVEEVEKKEAVEMEKEKEETTAIEKHFKKDNELKTIEQTSPSLSFVPENSPLIQLDQVVMVGLLLCALFNITLLLVIFSYLLLKLPSKSRCRKYRVKGSSNVIIIVQEHK